MTMDISCPICSNGMHFSETICSTCEQTIAPFCHNCNQRTPIECNDGYYSTSCLCGLVEMSLPINDYNEDRVLNQFIKRLQQGEH